MRFPTKRRLERAAGRKAAKMVTRHSVRGIVAKLERKPARAAGLVGAGLLVGLGAGWLGARATRPRPALGEAQPPTDDAAFAVRRVRERSAHAAATFAPRMVRRLKTTSV